MRLRLCPECNSEISDSSKTCPICGFPLDDIVENNNSSDQTATTELNHNNTDINSRYVNSETNMNNKPRQDRKKTMYFDSYVYSSVNGQNDGQEYGNTIIMKPRNKNVFLIITSIIIMCLLIIMLIVEVKQYKIVEKKNHPSKYQTLCISRSTSDLDDDCSDHLQIQNAIADGGQIIINLGKESDAFWWENEVSKFGAYNSNGYYYTWGAFLNYVASQGWELVSENLPNVYFKKEMNE